MTHSDSPLCPACGTVRTDEAPGGLCPACLMRGAMQPTGGGSSTGPGPNAGMADAAAPPLSAVAAAFPQWEVLELIGRGGMGAVFRIRQPKLNRLAALKIIPASLGERDPAFAGRFEREGELLARLHHPNIVNVHDSGRSGDFYYLLMEHVDGVNLRQAMRANRFTPQQALSVVPKICEALQYAHEEGVLHRDIKPENILLDSRGRVKLADFGIAKLIMEPASAGTESAGEAAGAAGGHHPDAGPGEPAHDPDSLTKIGSALGTPRYMAPEQAECPQGVDHRADIYSLGVVFYELLTGQLPAAGAFSPPSAWAAVDQRVDGIVRQALERERERRQRSAGEMKTQVETLAGGFSAEEIAAAVAGLRRSFDYRSKRTVMGMPLLHVAYGYDPVTRKPKEARGFFAFGAVARGVFAFGGRARGVFAFGGLATGVVAFGGVAVGIVSMGGMALAAGLALGGLAVGTFATGGMAMGWFCEGGMALGWNAAGGMVYAHLGTGGRVIAQHVVGVGGALPAGLRWVMGLSPVVAFTGVFMVVPLLAATLVPVWARRQVELGRGTGNQGNGAPGSGQRGKVESRREFSLPTLIFILILHAFLLGVFCYALLSLLNHSSILMASSGITPSKLARAASEVSIGQGRWLFSILLILDTSACVLAHAVAGRRGLRRWTVAMAAGMVVMLVLSLQEVAVPVQKLADRKTQVFHAAQVPANQQNPSRQPANPSAATPESATDIAYYRRAYEIVKAENEAGMGSPSALLGMKKNLAVAEALAANKPAEALAATLEWAKSNMELAKARHDAGMGTSLEWLDAQYTLAVTEAEVAQDPARAVAANRDWAKSRLELVTSLYQAGLATALEVEQAKEGLRRAEAKKAADMIWQFLPKELPVPQLSSE